MEKLARHATQYPGTVEGKQKRQLIMGVDFGTSFTKVVVADNRRAYPVAFVSGAVGVGRYLLPCLATIVEDGRVRLGKAAKGEVIRDIKLRILARRTSTDVIRESVAFLALALREARHVFMLEHEAEFGDSRLSWSANIGFPAEHYEDESLLAFYRQLLQGAWGLSAAPVEITVDLAEEWYMKGSDADNADAYDVVPEFVAQICGYVRSSLRQDGPHLLVDIGGGTMDVAVFTVTRDKEEDEDVFPILESHVDSQGVLPLHNHRLSRLPGSATRNGTLRYKETSSYDEAAEYFGVTKKDLQNSDQPFRSRVAETVRKILDNVEAKKYERLKQQTIWTFLCGGGANVELYQSMMAALVNGNYKFVLDRLRLPVPPKFDGLGFGSVEADRLSVAYGLSFDRFDIGTIRLPRELDAGRSRSARSEGFCPACGGSGGPRGNDCRSCGGSGMV